MMQNDTKRKSYGMDDYSDITPISLEEAARRGKRSIAIAGTLALLMLLFYVTTITRLSENLKKREAVKKKTTEVIQLTPVRTALQFSGKHYL